MWDAYDPFRLPLETALADCLSPLHDSWPHHVMDELIIVRKAISGVQEQICKYIA